MLLLLLLLLRPGPPLQAPTYSYGQTMVAPQSKVDLTQPVNEFSYKVKEYDSRKEGMDISVKHVLQKQLPPWVARKAAAPAPASEPAAAAAAPASAVAAKVEAPSTAAEPAAAATGKRAREDGAEASPDGAAAAAPTAEGASAAAVEEATAAKRAKAEPAAVAAAERGGSPASELRVDDIQAQPGGTPPQEVHTRCRRHCPRPASTCGCPLEPLPA